MADSNSTADDDRLPPRRRRKWKRWAILAFLLGGLLWLNGPGLRWLLPKAASHFLPKAGFRGSFELDGSLTGGFSLRDLDLGSDKALTRLTMSRATPVYRLADLIRGRVDGFKADGVHLELRLDPEDDVRKKAKAPLDLEALVKSLRAVRSRFLPLEVDLKAITLNATQKGKTVVSLGPSNILHRAGEANVDLKLGAITDATGRVWPARESLIVWNADDLTMDRVDPLPGVSVRGLALGLPAEGGPSVAAELHVDGAVFVVDAPPGLASVQVNLREGRVLSETVAGRFNLTLPASGELSSFSATLENLFPDPKAATGSVQLLLENAAYGEWRVPELSLDAGLEAGRATIVARGMTLGSGFSLNVESALDRSAGGFRLGDTRGTFNVPELTKLVAGLAERFERIDPAAPVPESKVDGDFHITFSNNRADSAEVGVIVQPVEADAAAAMAVKVGWRPEQPVSLQVELDGVKLSADLYAAESSYQVVMEFSDFKSTRIDPWLGIGKVANPGQLSLTGTWRGSGGLIENTHRGSFTLVGADLVREGVPQVHAEGAIEYDWPGGFITRNLSLMAADQAVAVDVKLADGFLEVSNLLWKDGEAEMAAGNAKLPVPADFSKWRDTLAHDPRPLEVSLQSRVIPLASLKDWLPAAGKLDPRSTGKLDLKVSGTFAEPLVDALLELKELRSPGQPKLPPADLNVTLAARDSLISVEGSATAPDFAPAVMTASMPFRPAEWADQPGLIAEEKLTARVDLPRVDLSRFASLVPGLRKVSGVVTGNIQVAGLVGRPEVKGRIDLTGGGLEIVKGGIPAVSGLGAVVDFGTDRITLKELKATVAGGTLSGAGALEIQGGKPGAMDFRVRGDHLPLKRDDSLIVRANADLRLSGTWEQASLTGNAAVVDSIFYRDIEILPIGSPFTAPSAASLPKIDPPSKSAESVPLPFRNWTLDVLARTENPFLVRGNLATGRLDANVRIGGTIGKPAPNGEVRISDFRASLPFSTLRVASGTLRFTPETGFDPLLEIRGSAEPRPYQVSVFVYGRASDPQLVLTSNPPLPENEIMTLLATGTTTSGLENPQAASSRALQLFAEELRRGRFAVGKRLRPLLGLLDRVDFSLAEADPYSSESFSTATLQITDRWYLSAGMGAEGDSRLLAIWRLRFY